MEVEAAGDQADVHLVSELIGYCTTTSDEFATLALLVGSWSDKKKSELNKRAW